MSFDPETAYCGDYQYRDRVKDVTWERTGIEQHVTGLKARFGLIDTPEFASVAASLGLSTDAAAVVVWEPKPADITDWTPAFDPKDGHILRREDTQQGWLIASVTKSQLQGKWLLLVDREVTNG